MRYYFSCTFFLLLFFSQAANGQNPFDLQHRLEVDTVGVHSEAYVDTVDAAIDTEGVPEEVEADTLIVEESDAMYLSDTGVSELETEVETEVEEEAFRESEDPETVEEEMDQRVFSSQDKDNYLLIIFLTLTIFLALIVVSDRTIMNKLYRSLINDNFLNNFLREQRGETALQLFFLYVFFVVNLGLFAYFFMNGVLQVEAEVKLWQTIGIVAAIYTGRYLFMQYLKIFVRAGRELNQYYFTIVVFNIFFGLVVFPLNAFAAFAPVTVALSAIYLGLFLFVIIYLLRQLRGLFIGSKYLFGSQFHFFIYLCTVEIAPLLILGKFFVSILY